MATNRLNTVLLTVLGFIGFILLFIYTVILSPIFLYRLILTKYIAPIFRPTICKAVNVLGQLFAAEFIPKGNSSFKKTSELTLNAPRCVIVVNIVLQGEITNEEIAKMITKGWLTVKDGESELRYPEFQQYIERWMGFMFFKQDTNFSLQNHLYHHTIPEEASYQDCEKRLCNLIESLQNKSFHLKRSPWEVHLLHNYKNPTLFQSTTKENIGESESMTCVVFRFHHGMLDGISILYAIIEGLMGRQLPSVNIASPQHMEKILTKRPGFCSASFKIFKRWIYIFWRSFYDGGYFFYMERSPKNRDTPWHCPDEKKKWKQLYCRSGLIPIKKIKFVKSQFGVSFTGTLLSILAAGSAENFKSKGVKGQKRIPIGTVVPLPGHPTNKLRNHVTWTLLELNVTQNMDPVERLRKTDEDFLDARHSQLPFIISVGAKLLSFPLASMSRYMCKNTFLPTALTNFPGPGIELELNGKKLLALDSCTGGLEGVCGVGFNVISYHDYVRISVTAEEAVMERQELEEMVKSIERELDILYERAIGIKNQSLWERDNESKLYRPSMGDDVV